MDSPLFRWGAPIRNHRSFQFHTVYCLQPPVLPSFKIVCRMYGRAVVSQARSGRLTRYGARDRMQSVEGAHAT